MLIHLPVYSLYDVYQAEYSKGIGMTTLNAHSSSCIFFVRCLSGRIFKRHWDDYTECSFIFLYILCTMSIRQNIQKMLGFAPSRAVSKVGGIFTPPANFKTS